MVEARRLGVVATAILAPPFGVLIHENVYSGQFWANLALYLAAIVATVLSSIFPFNFHQWVPLAQLLAVFHALWVVFARPAGLGLPGQYASLSGHESV